MSQMNNNIDNKTALYAEVFGKNERKNIFIQFIYNKDLVYNWNCNLFTHKQTIFKIENF